MKPLSDNGLDVVHGEPTGDYSPTRHGFTYWYRCARCRRRYLETTPEVSAPSLCQDCYSGQGREARRLRVMKED